MLRPLRRSLVMVNAIMIVCIVQLSITQKARLGAAVAKVVMPIVHVTETRGAAVVWAWAHVHVVSLTMTQDAVAPFRALFIHMIGTIFLTLAAIKPPLALASPTIECILVAPLLGYASDGGIVDEGGTNSMTITPCRSSSVAIMGTVVVMRLITSLNGVINMATIVCGGMCAGGGSRDNACGG
jgi:hypothetical protein